MLALLAAEAPAQNLDVWFGTSTPRNGRSKGIYHARFDCQSGKLGRARLAGEIGGPGFLAMHSSGSMLYAVASDDGTPSVVAFRIEGDGADRQLTKDSSVPIGDGGAAHVSVSPDDRYLFTAQYGGGSTASFQLDDKGGLVRRVDLQEHPAGSGVVPGRQKDPHAHWTGTSPDGRFVFVPDLGMDQVVIYRLEQATGKLRPHGRGVCPPGSGPRHMKFHPDGKTIYVLNELALSVTVFDYDPAAGEMKPVQTIATLPESVKSKERFNSASEIRVHPSGRFVYSANRGNDTITVFAVDPSTKQLALVEVEPIRGAWPRNFNLDPTGRWLLAAGRNTDSVSVFEIDPETGELQFTLDAIDVPTPICVAFGVR